MEPKLTNEQYHEKLLERAKEVGLDYHVVAFIRQQHFDNKSEPADMIAWIEKKLKGIYHKTGKRWELYNKVLPVLKSIKYPTFQEIVRPYE